MTLNISIALLEQVGDLAKSAGKEILKIYNSDFEVETKADASPVTEADRIAEALILRGIREGITAKYPIVGEEAFAEGNAPAVGAEPFWLVDALDGTKSFVAKNDEFTVNIALIEDGCPVLGVVHAPALNETYFGSASGAFAETGGEEARLISCRPPTDGGLVVVASRNHRTPELEEYIATLNVKTSTSAGSSLKFCQIASGGADIYPRLGRTMEWDTAAGHAVVEAAGGSVCTLDGSPLQYGKEGMENPDFIVRGLEETDEILPDGTQH
ncbi:MAG: 3'(2'),5'-bisphosphate nucleotidase CysQ [Rhodospirillaceae bacterium]|nr:3'(2'),5'-bisphosphate nucleotidase CysQ [Rhodospirillaceae bacterium]MBT4463562.1 3'(2'),5'-bisphosphate nucleotidase CysQ [Rhodospirillaceae bacterium]MBT5014728.1 3'(2'),5'-bisphosphate nucleotidase CysQ [Rhodospirillaceae bacterium]MBT5309442.1 3'(2'),5'-bisphosphate nucleotidase CysQ [Rhodospirillaceae bacterium]MBT6407171.1 3'(2'),5'-bisphosphate nucleotidase CysQ [Rhodospirillaceae bacterium]